MANTYTLIASNTVGSGGASSVTFSSIASTYTDLLVKMSARTTTGGPDNFLISFNGSSTNFSYRELTGNGTGTSSSSGTGGGTALIDGSTQTASTFSSNDIYIPNYAGSNYKSFSADAVTESNATLSYAQLWASLWSNTAAITQISLTCAGGSNFAQYSTFYLYGIKNS